MGADLVVYIVVGPQGFTAGQKNRLIKQYSKAWRPGAPSCSGCSWEPGDGDGDELDGEQCPNCGRHVVVHEDAEEAKTWATNMLNDWPPHAYRDVASREMPGEARRIIVVAGDMSWGDSPDGGGYRYLEDLLGSGLADMMGVK